MSFHLINFATAFTILEISLVIDDLMCHACENSLISWHCEESAIILYFVKARTSKDFINSNNDVGS